MKSGNENVVLGTVQDKVKLFPFRL